MTARSGDEPLPDGTAPPAGGDPPVRGGQSASLTFVGLLLCSAVFAVGYRLLMHKDLGQGVALFVGLPVILGSVIAMATAPRSALGLTLKVTALCMCVIAPLLGEGAVCLAMAAPLVFGVIGITAFLIKILSGRSSAGRGQVSCCALLVGLSPLLWEPAAKQPGWQDRRPLEELSSAVEIAAAPGAVWQALAAPPRDLFAAPLPGFLRLRLSPGTRAVKGRGLQLGATRQIRLDNDAYRATVTHSEPERRVTFAIAEEAAAPGERIALWLRFVAVEFELTDLGDGRTRLTQRTRYRRLLDPGFYFAPLERWGVRAMHGYTLALYADSATAPRPLAVAVR
jgi:hypothetical protein